MTTYEFVPEAGHQLQTDRQLASPSANEPVEAVEPVEPVEPVVVASQLKARLEDLGLTCDHFHVDVAGMTAIVSGDAAMQEQKEKILLALGNVVGVARVEDRITVGQEGMKPRFVTVQEGESLTDVAKRIYGDAEASRKILDANSPVLSGPDQIYPGQVLRAPA
ncbi:LysM peptidoglycan-binding domain-containing protein [Streptomyces sclerotialus]|uniref:LysM peptidoglycan-binding domain-containing protein n=1 Tax=Streptomyces sclerotialus TaxID=1957 RepID=UPI00099C69F6